MFIKYLAAEEGRVEKFITYSGMAIAFGFGVLCGVMVMMDKVYG